MYCIWRVTVNAKGFFNNAKGINGNQIEKFNFWEGYCY